MIATVARGKMDEVAGHAQKNAEIAENLATEFDALANRYLGSEPEPESPNETQEVDGREVPCLYGSLLNNHQRTRRALEQLQAAFDRLQQAYTP